MILTINNLTDAIAAKLRALWPERKVYVNEIPMDADGHFSINVTEATLDKKLDRRRERSFAFDISYYLKINDNLGYRAWVETMLWEFEAVQLGDIRLRCTGLKADVFDRIGHVLFNVRVSALLMPDPEEENAKMQTLHQEVGIRDGES